MTMPGHTSPRGSSVAPASPPSSAAVASLARAVIDRGNAVRTDVKVSALREAPSLMAAAQQYALELARLRRLDHTSPTPGRRTVVERIEAAGGSWQRAGENLALTSDRMPDVPRRVVELWLNSSGHRRNLLHPGYTMTGVGVARDSRGDWYVVQVYVLPNTRR
jgi:uncharacterized protein YkwD